MCVCCAIDQRIHRQRGSGSEAIVLSLDIQKKLDGDDNDDDAIVLIVAVGVVIGDALLVIESGDMM